MSEPAENDLSQSGSDETWRHFVYDDKWRIVATVIEGDDDAKESFVWHNAGLGGMGGSSYIDTCVLRDRDHDTGWDTASDGVLERRDYYVQNWRADVVALLTDLGKQVEHLRYSAYGEPFGILPGDVNSDGTVSKAEETEFAKAQTTGSPYHVLYDTDLDGDVDTSDPWNITAPVTLGYGALSSVSNRIGYAGYVFDDDITRFAHVRHRVYDTTLGRWTRRDPARFIDGPNSYTYGSNAVMNMRDPLGLAALGGPGCGGAQCLHSVTVLDLSSWGVIVLETPAGCLARVDPSQAQLVPTADSLCATKVKTDWTTALQADCGVDCYCERAYGQLFNDRGSCGTLNVNISGCRLTIVAFYVADVAVFWGECKQRLGLPIATRRQPFEQTLSPRATRV